ncbi:hypothetical protein D5E85_20705 [Vibrio parahaemolyticus]|uniref:hypothetical protein n=1 Tax=Vibrio diabolicus TaxID=50719 RepID=UPI0010D5D11A|nr:hypothetical protein [Vibrio diabolicus]MCS0028761.1 hypothetical protein [Vibrio alginolyticus]MCS0335849.1 hypothetical protein [Vibrio diabolicus]TBT33288.1 hypothetical protein D5E85_20705 [Vibrio parahaemolyticus]
MKYKNVIKISAIGTRGKVKGLEFVAKQNLDGHYVLNKKIHTPTDSNRTNKAKNKVCVPTLTEAANLLSTGEYLINLTCTDSIGGRALREYNKVKIIEG